MSRDLLIVGFDGGTHIGGSLSRAADRLAIGYSFADASRAFEGSRAVRALTWRMGHRPPKLRSFSREVVSMCELWRPRWLVATGSAPIDARSLARIGELGTRRLVFVTDDPWNRSVRADWFFQALPQYDQVYTPRWANVEDLQRLGCPSVGYLPFGFDPDLSFREEPHTAPEWREFATDVAFVGGADADRVPYISALLRAGIRVNLYGGYWNRFRATRQSHKGHADVATVRKATSGASVALCLVRRANRDGHVMRSLEIPAMGGCMLVEDTDEHRALFGDSGELVATFRGIDEMIDRVRWLLSNTTERRRLATAAHDRVHAAHHTYADRLEQMLEPVTAGSAW
ncbi:MAG: glycosyltransferase [Chloroflexi bacterium]|nr:glycosyltransferase [Chloroflexota bacterium]MBV9134365.1 glycosyltransferase [Chloroflexota bacterium]MBV9892947.1 glycosyltransferase [Chloroflexota bacterium]